MKKIRFIDLFAGIGGFHQALHNLGAECVFASEWDNFARQSYEANFRDKSPELFSKQNFAGDINDVDIDKIPDFEILCAGFPCQPFSQAGFKKGFAETRGTLFFKIAEIIQRKRPKAFFLENVRHLQNHDDGKTFETIQNVLTNELGYSFYSKIIKASDFGLPQHRPRLFMVGFQDRTTPFHFPEAQILELTMSDILGGECNKKIGYTLRVGGKGSGIHDRRNWDCYLVDGKEIRLNVEQAARMQGFPKDFVFPVSKTQALKQLGNSVAVPAVQATATQIFSSLLIENHNHDNFEIAQAI